MAQRRELDTAYGYAETPLGRVLMVGRGDALTGLYFDGYPHTPRLGPAASSDDAGVSDSGGELDEYVDRRTRPLRLDAGARREEARFAEARGQLDEYFDGRRTTFDLRLDPAGTAFQRAVWDALRDVRCGETTTYGELAMELGRPQASRAVGAANGANPISIVIPCHRVIGASGGLTGYGWGIDKKAWLLGHERTVKHLNPPEQ